MLLGCPAGTQSSGHLYILKWPSTPGCPIYLRSESGQADPGHPINYTYTLTHFADHSEGFSHDMINRYLAGDRVSPRLIWEQAKGHINV